MAAAEPPRFTVAKVMEWRLDYGAFVKCHLDCRVQEQPGSLIRSETEALLRSNIETLRIGSRGLKEVGLASHVARRTFITGC
jgi:hypothetical protein